MAIPKILDTINRGRLDDKLCSCETPDKCTETGFYTFEGTILGVSALWIIEVVASDTGYIRHIATTSDMKLRVSRSSNNSGEVWSDWSSKSIRESLGIYYGTSTPANAVPNPKEGDIYIQILT